MRRCNYHSFDHFGRKLRESCKKKKNPSATETPESTKTLAVVLPFQFGKVNKRSQNILPVKEEIQSLLLILLFLKLRFISFNAWTCVRVNCNWHDVSSEWRQRCTLMGFLSSLSFFFRQLVTRVDLKCTDPSQILLAVKLFRGIESAIVSLCCKTVAGWTFGSVHSEGSGVRTCAVWSFSDGAAWRRRLI